MSDNNAVSEFLEHYGVKGMRWGVRRSEAQLARAAGRKEEKQKEKEKRREESKRSDSSGLRSVNSFSDKELKEAVNRMNLEKQYAQLQPKTNAERFGRFMTDIGVNIVRTQLTQVGNQQASKLIGQFMNERSRIPINPGNVGRNPLMRRNAPSPRAEDRVG